MRSTLLCLAWLITSASPAWALDLTYAGWAKVLKRHVKADEGPGTVVDVDGARANPTDLDAYLKSLKALSADELKQLPAWDRHAYWLNLTNALALRGPGGPNAEAGKRPDPFRELMDPRDRTAVWTGTAGSPPLRREPYVGARLEAQLDDQAKAFLGDARANYFSPREKKLYLSVALKPLKNAKAFAAGKIAKSKAEEKEILAKDTDVEFIGAE